MQGYGQKIWKVISAFFMVSGVISFAGIMWVTSYKFIFRHFCQPKMKKALERFIKEVKEENFEELKNKKIFMDYENEDGRTFKDRNELIKACKRDFSKNYKILATKYSVLCRERNYYVEFENKSVYLIRIINPNPVHPLLCWCPAGYKVSFVDRENKCDK